MHPGDGKQDSALSRVLLAGGRSGSARDTYVRGGQSRLSNVQFGDLFGGGPDARLGCACSILWHGMLHAITVENVALPSCSILLAMLDGTRLFLSVQRSPARMHLRAKQFFLQLINGWGFPKWSGIRAPPTHKRLVYTFFGWWGVFPSTANAVRPLVQFYLHGLGTP